MELASLFAACLFFAAVIALIGHAKYDYLKSKGKVEDFGDLKNGWEFFVVYVGGWLVVAIASFIALLLFSGFIALFFLPRPN